MTSGGWCSVDDAAAHFGISRDKLDDAVADSERAGILVPRANHGTAKKSCVRFCVAKLDDWMLEVAAWRSLESSRSRTP